MLFGGANLAMFDHTGEADEVQAAAYNWLFNRVQIKDAHPKMWDGFVIQTALILPVGNSNFSYQLTIEDIPPNQSPTGLPIGLYNSVAAEYTGGNTTAYAEDNRSIARFGKHQHLITDTSGDSQTAAEKRRDNFLALHAWPIATPIELANTQIPTISIVAAGWLYSARWIIPAASGHTTVSDWLTALINECEFLTPGDIQPNTVQCESINTDSCYSAIKGLLDYKDHNDNIMRLVVDSDDNHTVHYRPFVLTPKFSVFFSNIYRYTSGEPVEPAELEPGIFEDKNLRIKRTLQDAFTSISNRLVVDQVGTQADNTEPTFGSSNKGLAPIARQPLDADRLKDNTPTYSLNTIGQYSVPLLALEGGNVVGLEGEIGVVHESNLE
ncbi:MAG: hypothetical protein M9918_10070 [Anaerolineae bacterium]|nr:hypothetical protein [Anaerolineae bacterium]